MGLERKRLVVVAGISPLLYSRNGYLSSIRWKDRFLDGNAEKKSRNEAGQ